MPEPVHLPVLARSVLFDERERVFLSGRLPFELDRAHRAFFDGVLLGGRSVAELLEDLPEELFEGDGRPSTAELTSLLADADSYVAPIPFEGPGEGPLEAAAGYDAVVVDLSEDREGPERQLLIEALGDGSEDSPNRGSVLLFSKRPYPSLPPGVDARAFREHRRAPDGNLHGFVQLVRSVLLRLAPTRLLLLGPEAAVFCHEAPARHATALFTQARLTPFLRAGRRAHRARRTALQVHLDLLYWLRGAKPKALLGGVLSEVRAAGEALDRALDGVDLILEPAPGAALRGLEHDRTPCRVETASAENLRAFLLADGFSALIETSTGAADETHRRQQA